MAIMICGNMRSGTTLLRDLCNSHPQMAVTLEFNSFSYLGKTYMSCQRGVLKRLLRQRFPSYLVVTDNEKEKRFLIQSYVFALQFMFRILRWKEGNVVTLGVLENTLRSFFPHRAIVGDKMPHYIYNLDAFVEIEGLSRVVIYRDCRDVVASTLQKVNGDWRGLEFTKRYDSAEKIARRWVLGIQNMQRCKAKLYPVRYEDLTHNPRQVSVQLAEFLKIDPEGFPTTLIRSNSVGKHKQSLSPADLDTVLQIAGPTLVDLGYRI